MKRSRVIAMAALMAVVFIFAGCDGGSKADEGTQNTNTTPPAETITAPSLTMSLPGSLTGLVAGKPDVVKSQTEPNCNFPGSNEDPFANGYRMTRFLVGLSQANSCFADFIVSSIVSGAGQYVGTGKLEIGDGSGGGPRFLKIEKSGNTYSLWLYFDNTNTWVMYMTWTRTSDTDATGQYIVRMAATPGTDSPDRIRVDFTRAADVDTNRIYIGFTNSLNKMEGFRVDVARTGTGANAVYDVKGMISLLEQPLVNSPEAALNLPSTEIYNTPSYKVVSVSDSYGKGASIQSIVDYAMNFDFINGTDSSGFDLGTYNHTIAEKVYFLSSGTEEWKKKDVTDATYIDNNIIGDNKRSGGITLALVLGCFEKDSANACAGILPLGLGTGYFTNTCTDTDGADCTAFMDGLYDAGAFGTPKNSTGPEPADWRKTSLEQVMQLDSVWPAGLNGTTTFAIPAL